LSLAWPWMLLLLPLPWVFRRWLPATVEGAALRVPLLADFALPTQDGADGSPAPAPRRPHRNAVALMAGCAWLLLVLAAARPQGFADPQQRPVSGRDLMIALDVSASMATRDLRLDGRPVERLHVARALARDFIARRDGDRVGLIVFGNQAYLHTPLTFDLRAVQAALDETGVGLAGRETAMGDAIALATQRLREFGDSARVLVLLTDGANTAGELSPAQATWLARREGLRIYTVGLGAERMRVVTEAGVQDINPSRDLDEDTLRDIARQTSATYHRATDSAALADFYRLIDTLEPTDQGRAVVRPARDLYPWPLGAALLLALLLTLQRQRRPAGEVRP